MLSKTQAERETFRGNGVKGPRAASSLYREGSLPHLVTFCHRLMLLPRHLAVWPRPCQAEHRLPLHAFSPRSPNDRDSALASRSSCSNSRGKCSGACASTHQRRPTASALSAGQAQRSNSSVCSGPRYAPMDRRQLCAPFYRCPFWKLVRKDRYAWGNCSCELPNACNVLRYTGADAHVLCLLWGMRQAEPD